MNKRRIVNKVSNEISYEDRSSKLLHNENKGVKQGINFEDILQAEREKITSRDIAKNLYKIDKKVVNESNIAVTGKTRGTIDMQL